ncbi:MAG: hypothetical protein HKN68_05180, partial [Saprospiraceae bacterium]|nr:hypothetical protein [Saprospiraceae bacterium]
LVDRGISPYHHLPVDLFNEGLINDEVLFSLLNSQEYFSVYPPFNQLFYWIAFKLSTGIATFSMILKAIYFLAVIIGLVFTSKVLPQMGLSRNRGFIFFLNPLVMVEGIGNLHIEVVMVSFLAGAIYYYHTKRDGFLFPFFYTMSLAVKLVPLIIAPFLWWRQSPKWRLKTLLQVAILCILFFGPVFIGAGYEGFMRSLDLYFRKFEFNGGVYYVFRYLGFQVKGYNLIAYIGPLLAIIVFSSIVWKSIAEKSRDTLSLITLSLYAWTILLCLSTTVHPWYIMPLIFLASFRSIWYPIIWSYLIMLTYINYSYQQYYENLWVVGIEYMVLLGMIYYELRPGRKLKSLKG